MSKFLVAGFIEIETIIHVKEIPVPYQRFCSGEGIVNQNIGGAGYSSAMALQALGDEVSLMSMVGKRFEMDKYKLMMQGISHDLKLDYILPKLEEMPTSIILSAENGEKQTFEDVKDIRRTEYDYDLFESQVKEVDLILTSNCNFCRPLIELSKKYNKPLAVNVRSMHKEKIQFKTDFLKAADIIYISNDDLDESPDECLEYCKEIGNPKIVIIGLGAQGVMIYNRDEQRLLEYKPVRTNAVVNTIGAGNALFSAFLHYFVKTGDEREAIKDALLFASYKIGFIGASTGFMTEEQIEQWKKLIWK